MSRACSTGKPWRGRGLPRGGCRTRVRRRPEARKAQSMTSAVTYRADIDGLRAVAVLSVLVFHVAPSALPGGFLGVDIFFVISGYLISLILLREQADGRFR